MKGIVLLLLSLMSGAVLAAGPSYDEAKRAIRAGDLASIQAMIKEGLDIHSIPRNRAMDLVGMAIYTKQRDILKALLDAGGADGPGAANSFLIACASNIRDNALIELLLSYGFDVNARDDKQRSCLYKAAENADVEFFSFLLSKGADPDLEIEPITALGFEGEVSVRAFLARMRERNRAMIEQMNGRPEP